MKFERRAVALLLELDGMPAIQAETIAKGEKIVQSADTGWDYHDIHSQFMQQLMDGFKPEKVDGAFIEFVKKKVLTRP